MSEGTIKRENSRCNQHREPKQKDVFLQTMQKPTGIMLISAQANNTIIGFFGDYWQLHTSKIITQGN